MNDNQDPINPFQQADLPIVDETIPVQSGQVFPTDSLEQNKANQAAFDANDQGEPEEAMQDERIVEYLLTQVIPTKNPDMGAEALVVEKDRLYKILESGIFDTAYSQLNEENKDELDTLMKYGADIPAIQAFFIEKIPNIQVQLGKYMEDFVQKYMDGEV